MIKKPSEEILEYIKNNYVYNPETGEIDGPNKRDVGYVEKSAAVHYHKIEIKNRAYRRSHIAWFLSYDKWPSTQLDHEDRNSLNDKIDNLRLSDWEMQNQNKDNYKGYRGFSIAKKQDGKFRTKNWRAFNQRKKIYLGYGESYEECVKLVDSYYEVLESGDKEGDEKGV